MTPEKFPLLRSTQRNTAEFDSAIAEVASALVAGSIKSSSLKDVKQVLSGVVQNAYEISVCDLYRKERLANQLSPEINDLFWSVSINGLHDVISASKKMQKSSLQDDVAYAMRSFCAEVLPLAEAVASLKDKVSKGRAPSVSPAKEVIHSKKTCPVCLRAIAVQGSTMAHHGYRRPEQGLQTRSCPGVRFRPLEVSTEGLEWLIRVLQNSLEAAKLLPQNRHHIEHLEREISLMQKFLELARTRHAQNAEKNVTAESPSPVAIAEICAIVRTG